jgi:hypothetical protein
MPVSRRFFLIGAGSLITPAFVKDARAALADTGEPLLLAPPSPHRELLVEWFDGVARLHLGQPNTYPPPPAPLWIEHLRACGHELETAAQIAAYCDQNHQDEAQLWAPVDAYSWEDWWEYWGSSEAKAYELLDSPKVFPAQKGFPREGGLVFERFPNPMSSARWVEADDPLSLSLLQARLNELDLSIAVRNLRREECKR